MVAIRPATVADAAAIAEWIRFHERLGFAEVARMPEVGAKLGRWRDLVPLQRRLDDRPELPPEGASD